MLSPEQNRRLRCGFLPLLLLGLLVSLPGGKARAQSPVVWGGTDLLQAQQGILDASLIPTTTGTAPVRYTNVNGQGYDIVVTTSGFTQDGAAVLPWDDTPGWWFEGGSASKAGASIPYSTVTFRFYQTGTTIPFGISGLHFRLEDAENGERLRAFGYWDAHGNTVAESFTDSCIFTYASGTPVYHVTDQSVDTGIGYEGGTQEGRWIDADLSPLVTSGFTFQAGRYDSNYGSIVLTELGDNMYPATELLIKSGSNQNISAGPDFLSGTGNAILTPATVSGSLASSDVTVTTGGDPQNIVLDETVVSGSGYSLSMSATQNIVPCDDAILLSSTTGSSGAISLTAAQTVEVGDLEAVSTSGNGGAISITAGNNIDVDTGIDSGAVGIGGTGGDIVLQSGSTITVDTIRSGGGGGATRHGTPGNISITATTSIAVNALYDDSGTVDDTQAILSAPAIVLGQNGTASADIQGTLYLQTPDPTVPAAVTIAGVIAGSGGLILDTGTAGGTAAFDTSLIYSGPTHVLTGILYAGGNSLPNSDLYLDNQGVFAPQVPNVGGSISLKSLTVATYATLDMSFNDAGIDDQVLTTGSATLNGIFDLSLPGDFNPDLGTTYQVLTFGASSGSFGCYEGVRFGDTVLQPVFTGTNMYLVATAVATGASQPLQTVPDGGIEVPAGGYYDGLYATTSDTTTVITDATIIDGTASADTTVTMSLDTSGDSTGFAIPGLAGVILDLQGTGTDKFVIQLDYNEAAAIAAVGDERNMFVGSSDGGSPYENAVFANTDLPGEANNPTEFFRAYNPATDFHLGYYGVDTVNNRVWAVLDHNSTFGLTAPNVLPSSDSPAPSTEPASHIMAASSVLNAEVNPDGLDTTAVFEFGSDPALADATVVSTAGIGTGTGFVPVTFPMTGLTPEATYYFRADGVTTSGTQYGAIFSFTTPPRPTVTVAATAPDAYELGPVPGSFTISQSGTAEVRVQYSIGGTATNGSRYRLTVGTATIPIGNSTFNLNATPIPNDIVDGDQTTTVTILPDDNYIVGDPSSDTVTVHDKPADAWKLAYFGASANTSSIAGDTAVNNNAGISNLLAYGLGLDPVAATGAGLPVSGTVAVSGSSYLTLNFTRNADAADLTYTVQGSNDLMNWTPVCTYSGGAWSPAGNVVETGTAPTLNVQARDSVPAGSAHARFLRLQITH